MLNAHLRRPAIRRLWRVLQQHPAAQALEHQRTAAQLDAWVTGPAFELLAAGDAVVDTPVATGDDPAIWSDAAYGKGSLGFLAIREEIGAAAFETALHDLATRYAWGEATPDDLRAAFETVSGQDLDALWSHWFNEAAMTQEEIDEIAVAFRGQPKLERQLPNSRWQR